MNQLVMIPEWPVGGMKRLLVCGTRTLRMGDRASIAAELRSVGVGCVVVHGGCGMSVGRRWNSVTGGPLTWFDLDPDRRPPLVGADVLAEHVCRELGIETEVHYAEWDRYGHRAGPIRNRKMIDSDVEGVLAFWDGSSSGTGDTIHCARGRGLPVRVVCI